MVDDRFKFPLSASILVKDEDGKVKLDNITPEYLYIPPRCDFYRAFKHYDVGCQGR